MRTAFRLGLLMVFMTALSSLVTAQEDYKATTDGWEVDLNKAIAMSKESGKPIMANFTGSDWCGWCIRLKKEVFSKDEFKKWASENVVLLELDFPRKKTIPAKYKQQNQSLAQAFGVRGYPTLWVFEAKDNGTNQPQLTGLAKTGYVAGGPAGWIKDINAKLGAK